MPQSPNRPASGSWRTMRGHSNAQDSAALAAWLKTSPVHVEEFLGVSAIARDLRKAHTASEYSLEAILARAQAEDDPPPAESLGSRVNAAVRGGPSRPWRTAAVTMAACAVLSLGVFLRWTMRQPIEHPSAPDGITALHFETRHGEQLSRRLADNSVLHLNTDSAVTIRYRKTERLVMLTSGQADFEVAHEPDRAFRVFAGSAEVVDLGTQFDVRLEHDSTVVTVVEGRVAVGPSSMLEKRGTSPNHPPRFVQLGADQQIHMREGEWPAAPVAVDAQSATAWLRREIVFDHEPLEHVAAEYNRYASKPIEIATPALRSLQISGVFATDDPKHSLPSCAASRVCGSRSPQREFACRRTRRSCARLHFRRQLSTYARLHSGHVKMPNGSRMGRSRRRYSGHRTVVSGVLRAASICTPVALFGVQQRSPRPPNPRHWPSTFRRSLSHRRLQHSPARPAYSSSMSPVSCVTRDPRSFCGIGANEALARMLEGTGLAFEHLTPRSIRILAAVGGPPRKFREDPAGEELQEVIVTASRREENLQDVPIAFRC